MDPWSCGADEAWGRADVSCCSQREVTSGDLLASGISVLVTMRMHTPKHLDTKMDRMRLNRVTQVGIEARAWHETLTRVTIFCVAWK